MQLALKIGFENKTKKVQIGKNDPLNKKNSFEIKTTF